MTGAGLTTRRILVWDTSLNRALEQAGPDTDRHSLPGSICLCSDIASAGQTRADARTHARTNNTSLQEHALCIVLVIRRAYRRGRLGGTSGR